MLNFVTELIPLRTSVPGLYFQARCANAFTFVGQVRVRLCSGFRFSKAGEGIVDYGFDRGNFLVPQFLEFAFTPLF
jgi:hypothetical protein